MQASNSTLWVGMDPVMPFRWVEVLEAGAACRFGSGKHAEAAHMCLHVPAGTLQCANALACTCFSTADAHQCSICSHTVV